MRLDLKIKQLGYSQSTFAKELGVTQASVSRWCNGVIPRAKMLLKIKNITGGKVTANDFFEENQGVLNGK